MRDHNFAISDTRGSQDPSRDIWECKLCNSLVSLPIGQNRGAVNRHMANRLACIDPMHALQPEDNEDENQVTYPLHKKQSTFDRVMDLRKLGKKV